MQKERQAALSGLPFRYYTDNTWPLAIIMACHNNPDALCMYNYRGRLSDATISSIFRASMVCRIGIRVPVVIGRTNLLMMLIWLFDCRFLLERVELDFMGLTYEQLNQLGRDYRADYRKYGHLYYPTTKARLLCYTKTHEVLARDKYQLFLVCENQKQAKTLKQQGLKVASK